jgi:hypothetical protein
MLDEIRKILKRSGEPEWYQKVQNARLAAYINGWRVREDAGGVVEIWYEAAAPQTDQAIKKTTKYTEILMAAGMSETRIMLTIKHLEWQPILHPGAKIPYSHPSLRIHPE